MVTIDDRHMIVGPISFILMVYFAILFKIITKMNYQKKFEWKFLPIYPFALIFLVLDFLYNIFIGSFLFLEFPKELLFTERLKRHKESSNKEYRDFAKYSCWLLSRHDPGHC